MGECCFKDSVEKLRKNCHSVNFEADSPSKRQILTSLEANNVPTLQGTVIMSISSKVVIVNSSISSTTFAGVIALLASLCYLCVGSLRPPWSKCNRFPFRCTEFKPQEKKSGPVL